jgi:3-methyladenine DNA glycosylase AlkC
MPKSSPPTAEQLAALNARKAPRRRTEVPEEIRHALHAGWIESKNLVEWLSVDRIRLVHVLADSLGWKLDLDAERAFDELTSQSALKQSWGVAGQLVRWVKPGDGSYVAMTAHPSDVVREWSALIIGCSQGLTFARRLAWLKTQADDRNAGVREWAWMALRSHVAEDPERAVHALVPWTGSRNDRLRRFASEVSRPCGVWCTHIDVLKQQPSIGLPVLEPLHSDDSLYVRNSVANWLNDASKSQPDWVWKITEQWLKRSPTRETQAIVKRARRTLVKRDA